MFGQRFEILVMSGSMTARYVLDANTQKDAEDTAMAHAKARKPRLREPYILQVLSGARVQPLSLNLTPEFKKTKIHRDGR